MDDAAPVAAAVVQPKPAPVPAAAAAAPAAAAPAHQVRRPKTNQAKPMTGRTSPRVVTPTNNHRWLFSALAMFFEPRNHLGGQDNDVGVTKEMVERAAGLQRRCLERGFVLIFFLSLHPSLPIVARPISPLVLSLSLSQSLFFQCSVRLQRRAQAGISSGSSSRDVRRC